MQQILKQLIELQKVDSELFQLERERGDLPNQVNRLDRQLEEAERSLVDEEQKIQNYQKEHGITEMDVKALEGKKERYQAQLFKVKTNREYDAVTHEIEAVEDSIGNKESYILELLDLEEETKKRLVTLKEDIEKFKSQLNGKKTELNKKQGKTEKEEAGLRNKRQAIVPKLSPQMYSTYQRIKKAKNGLAVVPIVRNGCSGCFKKLPPQRVLEVRQMNRLYMCEVCGRILVWDEKE